MGPMKLYRLLQAHVGKLNHLVVALYKEEIGAEKALETAKTETEKLGKALISHE